MSDIRKISVRQTITQDFEVNVDDWFFEFEDDWNDYAITEEEKNDPDIREDWLKEIAYDLAIEGSLGPVRYEDDEVEIDWWKIK